MDPSTIEGLLYYKPNEGPVIDPFYEPIKGMSEQECRDIIYGPYDADKLRWGYVNPISGNLFMKILDEKIRDYDMKKQEQNDKYEIRLITLTIDPKQYPKDWSQETWENTVRTKFSRKEICPHAYKAVLEHTKKGRIHCHMIAFYTKKVKGASDNAPRPRGINKEAISRYWKFCDKKIGIDVKKPNPGSNSASFTRLMEYISKETEAYQFSDNWSEIEGTF